MPAEGEGAGGGGEAKGGLKPKAGVWVLLWKERGVGGEGNQGLLSMGMGCLGALMCPGL